VAIFNGLSQSGGVAVKMTGWFVEKLDRIAYTPFAFLLPSGHFSPQRD
jgi:hypothetical protein